MVNYVCFFFFFFFQAEDGIRDLTVTGVQTCALPISPEHFDRGRPTRRARLRYVYRDVTIGTLSQFIESDIEADRKSTRLNSSHSQISYAVFCLKKKRIARLIYYNHS